MKSLITTTAMALLCSCLTLVPVHAALFDAFLEIDGVDGEIEASQENLQKLASTSPEPVALLLPAVQKVREAAARMSAACGEREGVKASCAAAELSDLILASDDGGDPALSLLDLFAEGAYGGSDGKVIKKAKLFVRKAGGANNAPLATESLLTGILIGLLREMNAAKMPDAVIAPIDDAAGIVAKFSSGRPTYDIKSMEAR